MGRPFMRAARCLLAALALASAALAAERTVRHVFPAQPGCTLKIDTYRGNLTITEGEAAEIRVRLHIESSADTEAKAASFLKALQFQVEAAENTVALRARNPRETGIRWVWDEDAHLDLDYEIVVPQRCHVEVKNRDGAVTIGNLAGRMSVEAGGGVVFLRRIDGTATLRVDSGSIVVSRCSGDVSATLRQGTIRLGTIGGNVTAKNSSGDIEVMTARAAVQADAIAGDVTIGFAAPVAAASRVTTSGGTIRAQIDPLARCVVDASTLWGTIAARLPVEVDSGAPGTRRLQGRLNGGGPLITLRASGGDVVLTPDVVDLDRAAREAEAR